jgi:UDP-3-O-[3-hydroxymyristoyl] glucosamine N-acyltransferase
MQFSAAQIAMILSGTVEGNPDATVSAFGKIEEAQQGNESLELKQPVTATLIRVPDAYTAFATLLEKYQQLQAQQFIGIEQPSYIHAAASIGKDVFIGAFAYISKNVQLADGVKIFPNVFIGAGVSIGANTIIHPGVKIYHDTVIGKNVTIHAGTVIGSDGFGFAPQSDGTYKKIPQTGNVIIEDNVEIGANTAIDRATIGSTIIKAGAKLDNLLQIAHNAEVGSNTVIAAQAGVSGSTKIGKNVMIGGQAGIVGHLQIADGCKINAQSGVSKSMLTPGSAVTGSPAYDYTSALRSQAVARRLPELEKRITELEKLIQELLVKE